MKNMILSYSIAIGGTLLLLSVRAHPLLWLSRGIDRLRAGLHCALLCWEAARQEWRTMYPSCVAWAQRDR